MTAGERFEQLISLMARLRAPDGCPWDREQNFATIKPFLLEETYEVMDAIDARDWEHLSEELGDLLLQAVFFSQMAAEAGYFRIDDAIDAINQKLIRRHPHVFGTGDARTPDEVKRRWDQIKAEEKQEKGQKPQELLHGITRTQPALAEAQQIGTKAATVGFDWPDAASVRDKISEELSELRAAELSGDQSHMTEELGDLLFAVVNLARHLRVDAEQALRQTNGKFRRRFAAVERSAAEHGRTLPQMTLDEMEALWQQAKVEG